MTTIVADTQEAFTRPWTRRQGRLARRGEVPWLRSLVMTDPARPAPDEVDFEQSVEDALASLPSELREFMSNVAIVIEDEPPAGMPLLGLYQGFPLNARSSAYAGVPPDKITIYQRPLERLYGADPERLRSEIRRIVLHEVAHHFGISDERLVELDRY
jgi:predicted Zn-dependent protease with MMP-like domain